MLDEINFILNQLPLRNEVDLSTCRLSSSRPVDCVSSKMCEWQWSSFSESVHSEFSWGEWEWKRPTSFWSQTAVSWKTHIHVPATGPHKEVERLAHPFLEENSFKIRHLELSQTETTVSERFWSRINELQIHETTGTFERRCSRSLSDTRGLPALSSAICKKNNVYSNFHNRRIETDPECLHSSDSKDSFASYEIPIYFSFFSFERLRLLVFYTKTFERSILFLNLFTS